MATEVLTKSGTPIVWANSGDYAPTGSGYTRTHQIDLTDVAASKAREGDKADLGATRARCYAVYLGVEMETAPAACGAIEVWWSESASGTAGTGNSGGAAGADGDYKNTEETEWKKQLTRIGALIVTADNAVTQRQFVGFLWPKKRYGMPIVVNTASTGTYTSGAADAYVALVPIINEVQ